MKTGKLSFILACLLIVFALSVGSVSAGEYEITRIIEVGPAQPVPMTWPLKWSPDGTKLAFFNNNTLFLSDTLGNCKEIVTLDLTPHRYAWLSNNEIILKLMDNEIRLKLFRLVKLDINTGIMITLEEYYSKMGTRLKNNPKSFDGPGLTIEGRVFYRTNIQRSTVIPRKENTESCPIVFPESDYKQVDDSIPPEKNHFINLNNDGFHLITCDFSDTLKLFPAGTFPVRLSPTISQDQKHLMVHSKVCNLESKECISINSVLPFPTGVLGYGFLYYSFNPNDSEVLFQLIRNKNISPKEDISYDEWEIEEEYSMAIFDYETKSLTVLDSLIGYENCLAPAFSPDGNKIAFISKGKCHIMYREEKP